jgi:hypothetical protein
MRSSHALKNNLINRMQKSPPGFFIMFRESKMHSPQTMPSPTLLFSKRSA